MPRPRRVRPEQTPGFAWRVSLSILMSFALVIFIIIWLFFFASNYSIYQNIAVVIAAFLVFFAIMGSSWASWGIKYSSKQSRRKSR